MSETFSVEEVDHCKAAMAKPSPLEALQLIASGRVLAELTPDGRDVYIDRMDGRKVRDPEFRDRKMLLAGAWPLYRAGMIDQFCVVTDAGREALAGLPA